jgi:D-alanyl-D-alanine carboxypeptidase
LVFRTGAGDGREIWSVRLGSGPAPLPLLATPFEQLQPQLSPDGRWIAYAADESGGLDVHLRPVPGGRGFVRIAPASGGSHLVHGPALGSRPARPGGGNRSGTVNASLQPSRMVRLDPGEIGMIIRSRHIAFAACVAAALFALDAARGVAQATNTLPADLAAKVEAAATQVIARTHVPSASVGIVQNGRVVYIAAFGQARLSPPLPASPEMHYAIGSISKQFTTACILILAQEGKLTLDDPVAKYFPELTRASEVTIRNLLSHTSGYQDYAPQDYTIPAWTKPTTAQAIVHEWATKPLDFDPGTQYQYSNTNFNIVGLIVEKVSGQPFWPFLSTWVLKPLGMTKTIDLDTQHGQLEPTGYFRNALGPLRPAVMEAPGWYFADGEMAMPVGDLLKWDISLMNQSLLQPESYTAMETEMKLKNGQGAHYGLGVGVGVRDGHRVVAHGGEVGGFVASNTVFPDDKIAIVVLTNQEASAAAGTIGRAISGLLLPPALASTETAKAEALVTKVLAGLQHGTIDRTLFTANANFFFDPTSLGDHAESLGPLGMIKTLHQTSTSLRGGMTFRAYEAEFANGTKVSITTYTTSDGKLEQFLVDSPG